MLSGLHKLCDKGQWHEVISALNQCNPSEANKHGGSGKWTALHIACRRNPPISVMKAFIERAPESLIMMDNLGLYPIHIAAEKGNSLQVMKLMVDSFHDSIILTDNGGSTPLHRCLTSCNTENRNRRRAPTVEELTLLLGGYKDCKVRVSSSVNDNMGNSPLHIACANIDIMSSEIILKLFSANPHMAKSQNNEGRTPLHLALLGGEENPVSLEVVKILLPEIHELEICKVQDIYGYLPIHCACRSFALFEVLQYLLKIYHDGAGITDISVDQLYPIDILEQIRPTIINGTDEMDDMNFKSDFLFCAFPKITPYCTQKDRLERLSELVVYEAKSLDVLSPVAKSFWIFLCTTQEGLVTNDLICNFVTKIVSSLGYERSRKLALVKIFGEDKISLGTVRENATDPVANILQPFFRFADHYEFDYDENVVINDLGKLVVHQGESSVILKGWDCSSESKKDIAIKFERNRKKYLKQLKLNFDYIRISIPSVIPILLTFDLDRIGTADEKESDKAFQRDLNQLVPQKKGFFPPELKIHSYRYAIVMPFGDRNLEEMIKHEIKHQENFATKKTIREIGHILKNIHTDGIIHCSLNLKNFLRIDGEIHLLGLDSAIVPNEESSFSNNRFLCGISTGTFYPNLFKSGDLPPEMFARLNYLEVMKFVQYWSTVMKDSKAATVLYHDDTIGDKIFDYIGDKIPYDAWRERIKSNEALWYKIQPRRGLDNNGNEFFSVIRCFKIDDTINQPFRPMLLPYELIKASPSFDIWNYGKIAFELVVGRAPFRLNGLGDLMINEDYLAMAEWNFYQTPLEVIMRKDKDCLNDPLARELFHNVFSSVDKRPTLDSIINNIFLQNYDLVDYTILSENRKSIIDKEKEAQWNLFHQKLDKRKNYGKLKEITTAIKSLNSTDIKLKFTIILSNYNHIYIYILYS